ncbi:DASH family cryptochrome [Paenibacillus lemnae]|uniref:Cryptochrome DASH n=1 Tax=Paenibacillus lemnae TaxID=1330551 RepID=A0A848M2T5_PAELE|nr:DASH family cryptochrome [Paenibacillus lemnae]NMO95065.1 DASH family cryptochrome [Paenibacillus lemnae]
MECSLVWFRKDLRVHDHEPLLRASASGRPVAGLYCFDPRDYGVTSFGFPKTGAHRARFLIESVKELRDNLHKLGMKLIVRMGRPEQVIEELAASGNLDIQEVYYHDELGSEEEETVKLVKSQHPGLAFHGFDGHSLVHPEDLPFPLEDLPKLYTPFQKIILRSQEQCVRPLLPLPKRQEAVIAAEEGDIPNLDQLGLDSSMLPSDPVFRGGSSEGRKRLKHYFYDHQHVSRYGETRNGLLEYDDSSKLSPYLALGCLSPRVVYWGLKDYEQSIAMNESTQGFMAELLWREYFIYVHRKYGDRIFFAGGLDDKKLPLSRDEKRIRAWCSGETGYPFVDANMRELQQSGWMSNRGRQNTASFLAKNLGVDWRAGAEWFESSLLDYDVSVNYGNWCYNSAVGNDTRPYRIFNVTKQGNDYDPQGAYARKWLPELQAIPSERIYEVPEFTLFDQLEYGVTLGEDYPHPIVEWMASVTAFRARLKAEKE